MEDRKKIHFQLTQDEDGYPPVGVESVWAEPGENPGEYIIDSIPFFIREATLDDIVRAREQDGQRWFEATVRPSLHSLIRVVFFDSEQVDRVNKRLVELGCSTEYLRAYKLLAVSIPPDAKLSDVQRYLQSESDAGTVDYEEPILRQ
jgi:uncharacterized protein DUF4265